MNAKITYNNETYNSKVIELGNQLVFKIPRKLIDELEGPYEIEIRW